MDLFLNVMQVMDAAGGPEPLIPAYLENERMAGVYIADRVVYFSRDGRMADGEVQITAPPANGNLKYVVTDLAAGTWRVTGPTTVEVEATEDGHVAYFEGPSGTYMLERIDEVRR